VTARPEAGDGCRAGRCASSAAEARWSPFTRATGAGVEVGGDTPEELVCELLAAELEARARPADDDRLVRRYNIEGRFALDEATGLRLGHKELLAGGLDELLRARLYG
jgi:hypothetical protein